MAETISKYRQAAIALAHVAGALFITYLFVIILMTATSQAGVAERLGRLSPPVDYNAGYATWQEYRQTRRDLDHLRVRTGQVAEQRIAAGRALALARDDYWRVLAPLFALDRRLRQMPDCEFDSSATAPAEVAISLHRLHYCLDGASLPAPLKAEIERLVSSRAVIEVSQRWLIADRENLATGRHLRDLAGQLRAMEGAAAPPKSILDSFSELIVLESRWLPGADVIARMPPSMTQIVLAFVSGMFGALLVTLVLIVYPRTNLRISSTAGGYDARILLGGLISLCVFVVLGGGTAVLGTAHAFSDGQANFLAFCAIGILAGMFSDRAAFWLSERADTFFRGRQREVPDDEDEEVQETPELPRRSTTTEPPS